jgi:hypothetical protein|tara:strand:- start:7562 stop:7663 length:102 start_codon:yes stop_codon:yes gene_type:complete
MTTMMIDKSRDTLIATGAGRSPQIDIAEWLKHV